MNYASDFLWHQERNALQNGGSLLIQRLLTVNKLENSKVQSHFLNNDILRYILVLLAQDPARSEKDPDWPWYTLSHVSRQWRTVALSTPAFWSSIVSKPLSCYMLHTQLLRSKSSNLSITFVDLNLVLAPYFRDVFRTQGSRITELYIRMTDDLFWLISFDFLHTNLLPPMLKVLHLELAQKNGHNHGEYVLIENILTLSELRSLSIRGLQTSVSPTFHIDNLPPLENLTNFTAYEVDFDDITFKDIVRLFPNVENLSIEDCKIVYVSTRDDENKRSVDADEENASEDDGPHLPSLRTLKLHGIGSITALQIFHDLDLPPTSNWDIHCVVLSEYALGRPLHNHTFDLHMRILQTIFKRRRAAATDTDADPNSKCENLSIIINNREFRFETLSLPPLAESPDNSSSSSRTPNRKRPKEPIRTNVTMNYASSDWTNTLPDYLSSITHHITTTPWRTARSLRFGIDSAAVDGVITRPAWIGLLSAFDELRELDVTLVSRRFTSQMDFVKALSARVPECTMLDYYPYVDSPSQRQYTFLLPKLRTLTLRLSHCRRAFLTALADALRFRRSKYFAFRHESDSDDDNEEEEEEEGLTFLRLAYPSKPDSALSKVIQEFRWSMAGVVREVEVDLGVEDLEE